MRKITPRRRGAYTLPEVLIAVVLTAVIFGAAIDFTVNGMRLTLVETDRLSGVRAMVLLRALVAADLARTAGSPGWKIVGADQLEIAGGGAPGGVVTYSTIAAGAGRGEIYRFVTGAPPRRVGSTFRGKFELHAGAGGDDLVVEIQAWKPGTTLPARGAPPISARFSGHAAGGTSPLAGRFQPVLPGGPL